MTFDGVSLVKDLPIIPFGTRSAPVSPSHLQFIVPYSFPKVKGTEVGRGRAHRKGEAKDEAAQRALEELLSSESSPRISMLTLQRRNSFP